MKKTILKMVACILVLSLSLTVLQPLAVFAEQNINSAETTLEKWVPSEEDMRLPDTTGDLTLEQLETAKLSVEDIPEYIRQQDIEEKGHVNRLREQEPDDNTIVFQNRDGTKTAYFFSSPVKYTDESGNTKDKYTKLDNKNIPDKHSKNYGYVNQQNDIKTYFPKQIASSQGMLLENENVSVELIPIEATEKKYVLENGSIVTPGEYISKNQTVSTKTLNNISTSNGITKIQSEKLTAQKANANKVHITDELTSITKDTVQYNGVFGSKTTLRYSSTFEGLKEDIVLSENTGVNNFSFRLKTNGLSLVCGDDKQYYLADPLSGEYLVAIGELIVYDSNNRIYKNDEGEEYNHHYEVTTVKTDQEYILTVVVDEEFLNSSDTVYPVYIDPTMTVMPKGDVMDAAIYSGGTVFINDDKEVKIGCSSSYGTGRGLYNFPILNFNTDFILMYGNQISSAKLYLYARPYSTGNTSSFDSSKTLSMYEFYSSWSPSTVKWNNTSPYNYGTYISSSNVTSGWTTFDISYIVDKFKTDPDYTTAFKGVIIKANSENTSTWKKFVSSLHPTLSNQRPYIQITYNDSPTACSQVVSGATYYLKNYNSEYLDVYDSGTADNTQLLTYAFNGNANQQFKITNVYGGEYEIAPQHTTGKVLSVNSSGQVVIEEDCNLSRQRWYIFYRNGSYHIVNKLYNSGVMEATYDSDYVNVGSSYDYCCWELEMTIQLISNAYATPHTHIITKQVGNEITVNLTAATELLGGYVQEYSSDILPEEDRGILSVFWPMGTSDGHHHRNVLFPLGTTEVNFNTLLIASGMDHGMSVGVDSQGYYTYYIDTTYYNQDTPKGVSQLASVLLSFVPILGETKDVQEGVTGVDILTGETLSSFDRVVSIVCVALPVISGSQTRIVKKGFTKLDNVDELFDASKGIVKTLNYISTLTTAEADRMIDELEHNLEARIEELRNEEI